MNGVEIWLDLPVTNAISGLEVKSLAVDVGANVGSWSIPLTKLFDNVVAFEPDERNFDLIPSADNLTVVKAAISDFTGQTPFFLRETSCHNSLLPDHPIGGEGMRHVPVIEELQVPCITLDDACEDGADLVKIDIEGGEVIALRGCLDAGRWSRTVFIVECHGTYSDVESELVRLGKTVTKIDHPLAGSHPLHCWALGVTDAGV
jgi:FkbM family methyltransferase